MEHEVEDPEANWVMVPSSSTDSDCILPFKPPPGKTGGWSTFIQSARSKLYTFYKMPREDFRFSGSPIWLLGSVYGRSSDLKTPQRLALLLLRPQTGLTTIERSYPDKQLSRTFGGSDAIAFLEKEFPDASRPELLKAMEGLLAAGLIEPLGSIVPDYLLGGLYFFTPAAEALELGSAPQEGKVSLRRTKDDLPVATPPAVQEFMSHFQSLIWFTYRTEFPPIEPTQLTTDTGWGCMLRTGQMMLANAFLRHKLGRGFRLHTATPEERERHDNILRLFADRPGKEYPYSIHNVAHLGTLFRKSVGEWFGPSVITNVLKVLVRKYSHAGFTLYLAQERVVYRENVHMLSRTTPPHTVGSPRIPASVPSLLSQQQQLSQSEWRPVIILTCLRLGIDSLNPIYVETLAALFKIPQMVGIIGGKPNASLYFVGMQDDSIIYLDPHYAQPAVNMDGAFDSSSFHNHHPLKMPCKDIDPCLALAFVCSTADEFEDLCASLQRLEEAHPQSHVLSVGERDPNYSGEKKSLSHDPLEHLQF